MRILGLEGLVMTSGRPRQIRRDKSAQSGPTAIGCFPPLPLSPPITTATTTSPHDSLPDNDVTPLPPGGRVMKVVRGPEGPPRATALQTLSPAVVQATRPGNRYGVILGCVEGGRATPEGIGRGGGEEDLGPMGLADATSAEGQSKGTMTGACSCPHDTAHRGRVLEGWRVGREVSTAATTQADGKKEYRGWIATRKTLQKPEAN